MLWARVVRGIASMANEVISRSIIACTCGPAAKGSRNPMRTAPEGMLSIRPTVGGPTVMITSAPVRGSLPTSAPADRYCSSSKPAASPAPDSIETWWRFSTILTTTCGVRATRRSPVDSLGTAIRISFAPAPIRGSRVRPPHRVSRGRPPPRPTGRTKSGGRRGPLPHPA